MVTESKTQRQAGSKASVYSVLFRLPVFLSGSMMIVTKGEGEIYSHVDRIIRTEKSLLDLFMMSNIEADYNELEITEPERQAVPLEQAITWLDRMSPSDELALRRALNIPR